MKDKDIEHIIRTSFLNQYIYAKIQFDNAKDTTALIAAADENAKLLINSLEYRVKIHKEEIIEQYLMSLSEEEKL